MARHSSRSFAASGGSIWITIVAWSAAVVLLGLGAVTVQSYLVDTDVRVPIVEDLPLSEARRLLLEAGLGVSVQSVESSTRRADVVVEQAPAGGSVVRVGRIVDLAVTVASEGTRMPTVVGKRRADATSLLEAAGLAAPDVSFVVDDRPYGTVIAQRPLPGELVLADGSMAMVISRGAAGPTQEVPDLFGVVASDAAATLRSLGFRSVDVVTAPIASTEAGTVAQQQPPAGAVVELGRPIVLSVAVSGDRFVRVPDVSGMPTWQARVALIDAGLNLGPVESVQLSQAPRGVVGTRPEGLTVPGAPVALIVNVVDGSGTVNADAVDDAIDPGDGGRAGTPEAAATGEAMLPEGARAIPFLFDPRQMGVPALLDRSYRLTLVVRDDQGERTLLDRTMPPGEAIRERVIVIGDDALLQTFVNDIFFQAWRP